jgi:hypothetical protein
MNCRNCGSKVPRRLRGGRCPQCQSELIPLPANLSEVICDTCSVKRAQRQCDVCLAGICEQHGTRFVDNTSICPRCLERVPERHDLGSHGVIDRTMVIGMLHCVLPTDIPIHSHSREKSWFGLFDRTTTYFTVAGISTELSSRSVAEEARLELLSCVASARKNWDLD